MPEPIFYPGQESAFEVVYRKNICTAPVLPHIHDGVEIYLTLSSLPNVLLGNQVVSAEEGSLIIIPPFCVHQLFDRGEQLYERYILSINAVWLNQLICDEPAYRHLLDTAHPLLLPLGTKDLQTMQQSLDELLDIREKRSFGALKILFECMEKLERIIRRRQETPDNVRRSVSQQTVTDIIRYLDKHIDQPVMLKDLSDQFHLHPDYISRIFKKHTKTTVSTYITLQKIARAQQLLQEGYTVSQAQLMTGYASYAHFSRTFKKYTGISPGAYRKQNHCLIDICIPGIYLL